MNRVVHKSFRKLLVRRNLVDNNPRQFSSRSSGGYKLTLIVGSGTVAAATLTYFYAKYDKKFADQLSSYLPLMKSPLSSEQKLVKDDSFEKSFMKKPVKAKAEPVVQAPIVEIVEPVSKNHPEPIITKSNEKNIEEIKHDIKKTIEIAIDEDRQSTSKNIESEIRHQVKRLIYAFNEFYEEKRIMFETELKRQYDLELKEQVINEKKVIMDEYVDSYKKLKQMENLLQIRDQLDKQEKASKKLWILSQAISKLMEHKRSLSKEPVPLQIGQQLDCIRKVVKTNFQNDSVLEVALESITEDVSKNGVYSEDDLINRFAKMEKICNQVSLVTNEYTPFYGYLISFAHSFIRPFYEIDFSLTLKPIQFKQIPQNELDGTVAVDCSKWDTYDILKRVRFCIEQRNLEMALRYANQLSGEPRKVAKDWIKDTRKHLEVKQALDLIQSKISAINIHQLAFTH